MEPPPNQALTCPHRRYALSWFQLHLLPRQVIAGVRPQHNETLPYPK